ncbi:recombinase family protein, partial [Butyricicoccus sp. 1XD8-22]
VSRFARNVLDTLDTVRMLKSHGVRLIFEKEDIDTENMQSEFILTMMAAVAQEESRSISENVKWANMKRLERGEARFTRLLGYTREGNRKWVIQTEEASIVKEAFDLCLQEKSPAEIARIFVQKGYQTAKGNKEWSGTGIREILRNNAYIGEILSQKSYSADHLSRKSTRNWGEKKQYLIEDHHEAI